MYSQCSSEINKDLQDILVIGCNTYLQYRKMENDFKNYVLIAYI